MPLFDSCSESPLILLPKYVYICHFFFIPPVATLTYTFIVSHRNHLSSLLQISLPPLFFSSSDTTTVQLVTEASHPVAKVRDP